MGQRIPGEQTDAGIMAAFRQVVADFEPVFAPAQVTRSPGRKVVGKSEKDFGPEGLEQCPPAVSRQGGSERTDALRGDDRNALRLPGKTEELFIACRVALAHGREVLILVAQKQDLTEVLLGICFNLRHAIEDGAFEVELHHYADGFREARVHSDGEIERTDLSGFDQPGKRWERLSVLIPDILFRVVALLFRTEDALYFGAVVKQR